ncbi:reverse transcriptase family protein [Lysobacter capsici]|uniref:RNA-directed DNA polymerase n=1 Tax=Lysobacter capsici TaxID=435897 RepID=UPI00071653D0|nr:RNA-directed DNA polymerase [Lysobacter capsici]ALN88506.1 reverse transcriptase family protein [Lysobacter capsici]
MAILTEASLDFAKAHIEKYYDSDFFPKAFEFEALWHHWPQVKQELQSKNISKFLISNPYNSTIQKARGGYRVVHQLEPMEAIAYTAMAYEIGGAVEAKRTPASDRIACSYRINIANGSFFDSGSGWGDFKDKSQELADENDYAAITDISDFYNQIYLHRLQNAIEAADVAHKSIASDIEDFLLALNNKASQGVPVGPASSIIMAEAVMIDIDAFISQCGVAHTRYVDDIRMFSDSEAKLAVTLEKLTLYLYENHRLTLATDKTKLMLADEFVEHHLHNPYLDDKDELMEELDNISPYGGEDYEDDEGLDEEDIGETLADALEKILEFDYIDLGLARSIIRTARRSKIANLISPLLDNFAYFAPVTPDLFLYLEEVMDASTSPAVRVALEAVCDLQESNCALVRLWLEHFISSHTSLLESKKLKSFVMSGPNIENKARAAITLGDIAWVRTHKAQIYNVGARARRAIINAARVLPSDERNPWLGLVAQNAAQPLEKWLAGWVKATA